MGNAFDRFYLLNKFLRLLYFSISTNDNMRINTENTGAYFVLKPCHDGNNNDQGHNADANTDNRDPCRKGYENLLPFGAKVSKTDIRLEIHVALILLLVFYTLFYQCPGRLETNQYGAGRVISI